MEPAVVYICPYNYGCSPTGHEVGYGGTCTNCGMDVVRKVIAIPIESHRKTKDDLLLRKIDID